MPDIDLDFPRDIREVLIPRVHERYGAEHSALVAAFPTYRPRGAVRDLGKALGLPPAEIERVAKMVGFHERSGEIERDVVAAIGAERAATPRWRALLALCPRGDGPAPPRLPAPRRDGDLDRAAGRRLPGRAGGDGGAPDRPVGQGLLRRRRLPQDRPARAWGCSPRSSAASTKWGGRARSALDLSRIPLDDPETYDSIRAAETTGVFQIESRAQMQMLPRTLPREPRRPHRAGGAGPARPDPGRRRPPLYREAQAAARGPRLRGPLRAPAAGAGPAGDAGHDRLPGAGDRGGDGAGRLLLGRGRGAAAGDEPQALRGGDASATTGASSPAPRERGVPAATAERVWAQIQGFSGFGFPKAHSAAFGLLAYQSAWLRVHRAARVPLRPAQRAADGLLPARRPRPRGPAPRHPPGRPRRQPQPGPLPRRTDPRRPRGTGRPRLRQGRARGGDGEPGERARPRRSLPRRRRPRFPLRCWPRRLGAPSLGRRPKQPPVGAGRLGGGRRFGRPGESARGFGMERTCRWRCRWSRRGRRS